MRPIHGTGQRASWITHDKGQIGIKAENLQRTYLDLAPQSKASASLAEKIVFALERTHLSSDKYNQVTNKQTPGNRQIHRSVAVTQVTVVHEEVMRTHSSKFLQLAPLD